MDIIIRNGVIQKEEQKIQYDLRNREGLLKKDFKFFDKNISGPYYDLMNSHLHIYRKAHLIPNFNGPQNSKLVKIVKTDYNKNDSFCAICHELYTNKFSFLSNRKDFIEDEYYKCKEIKIINNNKKLYYKKLTFIELVNKYINSLFNSKIERLKEELSNSKKNTKKIFSNFYKIVYKLLYKPFFYPLTNKETKIIWPWELTNYQKLRLNNQNYNINSIFLPKNKIITNYIIIE